MQITPKTLVYGILYFTLIMGALIDEFHFPSYITYINDVMVILLLYSLSENFGFYKKIKMNVFPVTLSIFAAILLIGIFSNLVPFLLVVWAIRNTFRFFVFLYGVIVYLDIEDVDIIFTNLYKIQWVNLFLGLYQYFILGLEQDALGGIFGHGNGAGLTSFSCLMVAYGIFSYNNKNMSVYKLLFICLSSLLLCTLAEEKMFFFEFAILMICSVFFTKFSMRKLGTTIFSVFGYWLGLQFLEYFLPWSYERVTNFDSFMEYGMSTTGGYNISRFGAFGEINEMFFKNNIVDNLFGYGFGSCEFSKFSVFTSNFYNHNGWLNYRWFAHQWMFLESGYLGLFSYIAIIIGFIVYGQINSSSLNDKNYMYCGIGKAMAVITIISMWCNALVKVDQGYIPFFGISLIGVAVKYSYLEKEE